MTLREYIAFIEVENGNQNNKEDDLIYADDYNL